MLLRIERQDAPESTWGDEPASQWELFKEEWFALQPLSGREYEQAQQIKAETTHTARCTYLAGVLPKMRLVESDTGRTFEIESAVNWQERNRYLDLRLVERHG